MGEKTLVLIKPDAMAKGLAGHIISDLSYLNLKMVALKLLDVKKELAEKHYEEHKGKHFYKGLIKYIMGELHGNEKVIAIVYEGKDAVNKVREFCGATHPDRANPRTIRGRYGKINTEMGSWHETVIHASDSPKSAKREIALWFHPDEIIK
jgi:nucleoside-diphosphate kinase